MRIAQIAPLYEDVPPAAYGGTERVISTLCDELVRRGHDVTLFATSGSRTLARLEPFGEAMRRRMTREEMTIHAPRLHDRLLRSVYARADEFDVIHSHADVATFPFAEQSRTPTVVTMHGRLDEPVVRRTVIAHPTVPVVSISDHQRLALADLPVRWAATVHNGLDLRAYFDTRCEPGDHLAFVGRISPEKGPETAVEIAARTGRQLHVGAKVDPFDLEYYETTVRPLFEAHDVHFHGELDEPRKPAFYASAAAVLFPSDWPEPFGLVMIEALAAGAPVIALRRGAVPEVLIDGVTGFICDDVDEMVQAVGKLDQIDREACRRRALEFNGERMAASYEQCYRDLVESLGVSAVAHA